jgi:hypothetical protein
MVLGCSVRRVLLYRWLSWMGPWHCTDAFGPDSWFGGHDWLYRCRSAGTTSQHRFFPGASSTFARPYTGSCWHPSVLLMVHHVVQSACCSLCSKGELSRLFLIIHWQIPSGALAWCSSQRGISIGPNSFYRWGCGGQCLSILGATWFLFPPERVLCPGHSVCSVLRVAGSQLAATTAATACTYLMSACASTLWQWVHLTWLSWKGIDTVVFSALTVLVSAAVLL